MADTTTGNPQDPERAKLGRYVVYFALGVIGVLGLAALLVTGFASDTATANQRFVAVKDILSTLLPVLGTWVGTVLAFYFSRDNFDAAAKQTSDLVRQLTPDEKLQTIPAKEAWIAMTDPGTVRFVLDKAEKDVKLKADILDPLFTKTGRNRLPLIDAAGKVVYMIHRSIIDKFIAEQALGGNSKPEELSLAEFLASDQYKQIAMAFGTVKPDAHLKEVKLQIDGNPDCSDVFATEDGTKSAKALGWITNGILQEKSRV